MIGRLRRPRSAAGSRSAAPGAARWNHSTASSAVAHGAGAQAPGIRAASASRAPTPRPLRPPAAHAPRARYVAPAGRDAPVTVRFILHPRKGLRACSSSSDISPTGSRPSAWRSRARRRPRAPPRGRSVEPGRGSPAPAADRRRPGVVAPGLRRARDQRPQAPPRVRRRGGLGPEPRLRPAPAAPERAHRAGGRRLPAARGRGPRLRLGGPDR